MHYGIYRRHPLNTGQTTSQRRAIDFPDGAASFRVKPGQCAMHCAARGAAPGRQRPAGWARPAEPRAPVTADRMRPIEVHPDSTW